jgi:predicted CXXCH cytochrome family protein
VVKVAKSGLRSLWVYSLALWLGLTAFLVSGVGGCKPSSPPAPVAAKPTAAAPASAADPRSSQACRECHADFFDAWKDTDHALANRLPQPEHLAAFASFPGGLPAALAATGASASPAAPFMILGHKPIWQALVPAPGGRWQAHDIAHDPVRGDWFNVFGNEQRQPGDWGHWTGRGMNWNTMCAQCHMTGYKPNYDVATDSFHSTWVEQGIGCIQCHGEPSPGHGKPGAASVPLDPFKGDRSRMMQTCAPCHARNEALTATFKPGDDYHDHYRVTLPVVAGTFYPDGQQRDEDFNWTSLLLSRMGHAGVSCLDCHDPHTNKTILPVQNNALCMQCHSAPGRLMPGGALAVPIEPLSHSRHAEGSAGNSCVACHMPTTNYMQRSPRHDHGWLKPDPLLTRELGIPNACSKCHEKEGLDWVITKADAWYGAKLDSRQRTRARTVAAAQAGDPGAPRALLDLLAKEDIPAWRATYLDLLAPAANQPAVRAAAESSLRAATPLERAAAVRLLAPVPGARPLLRPLLKDPVRLVRIDASLALTDELPDGSASRAELEAYFDITRDQPLGLLRIGFDQANRGQLDEAALSLERASKWDPSSSGLQEQRGQLDLVRRRPADAAARFIEAARLAPADAQPAYYAALAFAEAGQLADAESSLRTALQRDPALDRAWYNLGLLLAQKGDRAGGLAALATAEKVNPRTPDYPYAAATLHWHAGDRAAALAAARRALAIDPAHAPSLQMLGP